MAYSFKCFGNGVTLKILEVTSETRKQLIKLTNKNVTLTELIFNLETAKSINFGDWESHTGVLNANLFKLEKRGKIEIKLRNKKILSTYSGEICTPKTLFPLFNTRTVNFSFKRKVNHFYIISGYYTTGQIGSMTINADLNFDINLLEFHLVKFPTENGFTHLAQVSYNKQIIPISKDDYVIRGCFAEWYH